jgi:hypothetical protein
MYAMYYASMLRCWQLVKILVRTNHPYLRVGRHARALKQIEENIIKVVRLIHPNYDVKH